MGNNTGVLSNC